MSATDARARRLAAGAALVLLYCACAAKLDVGSNNGATGCPELTPDAGLADAGLGDCVRVFAQGVANAATLAQQAETDVVAACDAIADAGGMTPKPDDDVAARCKLAASALTTSLAFASMRPFTITTVNLGACLPSAPIPCGGCSAATCADASPPPSGFVQCSPVEVTVTTGKPPGTTNAVAALAALRASLPVLLGVMNRRNDSFSDLNRSLTDESNALGTSFGDPHENACAVRANSVAGAAYLTFGRAIAGAGTVLVALYEQS